MEINRGDNSEERKKNGKKERMEPNKRTEEAKGLFPRADWQKRTTARKSGLETGRRSYRMNWRREGKDPKK